MQQQRTVPHFAVTTVDGRTAYYGAIWQHKSLVLVLLPAPPSSAVAAYAEQIGAHADAFAAYGAECVVTSDAVAGFTPPTVVISDRWGEIVFEAAPDAASLPRADEIAEWLQHVQHRCPECEGEAR